MRTQASGWVGELLAWIFGGIFIAAGLAAMIAMNWGAVEWLGSSDWVEVPARLEQVDLHRSSSSEGSDTLSIAARYTYRFGGLDYSSDRVDFHPGADNLGDYHERQYRRLNQALQAGRTVSAWVDPERPENAVLVRELRPARLLFGGMFLVVFGGAGALVIVMMRRTRRRLRSIEDFRAEHPDRPCAALDKWRTPELRCDGGSTRGFITVFALLWNLVSVPILFVLPGEIADGNYKAAVGLLFPLIGAGLAAWAVVEWRRARRYGAAVLRLDRLPVPRGGLLQARLEIPARLQARELQVQVSCVRITQSGSGKNRRTDEALLWEDSRSIPLQAGLQQGGSAVRIEMPLPGDRPEASEDDPSRRVVWRLVASSAEPGIDFRARFELPVFQVAGAEAVAATTDATTGFETVAEETIDPDAWRETGVEHGFVAGGQRFHFPRFRMAAAGIGLSFFGLLFVGAGLALWLAAGEWFIGAIFAFVGSLVAWGGLTTLFDRSEIQVVGGRLRWRGRIGGWQELQAGAIRSIGIARSGQINQRLYYRIELHQWGRDGATVVARWVPNERAARSLAAHLSSTLGVQPEPG